MKILTPFLILFSGLFFSTSSTAQPLFPADGELYINSIVPRVDILINPDSLAWIYENVESDREFHATFIYDNGNIHDTVYDIGFRLRGNTSRFSAKKSFKVSFNTWIQGQKYQGVEKMNLNGEHNDPSISRARLYWDILHRSALAGPRSNHVQVFINGNYYGLYLNCEHIDEEFVKSRFGNNDGNLYKCLWPAQLNYLNSNPDSYKFMAGDHRAYDLKTNINTDDYSDLAEFIDVLNNTPINQLACKIEKVFNVQDYLKTAAIDILTSNWDGYIFNKNNFYLYHNTSSGMFEYIPYDTDNTFGIDWFGIDWRIRNIYNWSNSGEPRPLYTRLLQVPEYRAQFSQYLSQMITEVTGSTDFLNTLTALRDQLADYVATDPYYPLDYGYTINSFNTSFESGTGAHVPYGIRQFILDRNSNALAQLENTNAKPVLKYLNYNTPAEGQNMIISAYAYDATLTDVELEYRINGSGWQNIAMTDDGQNGDVLANDHIYTVTLPEMTQQTMIEFSVEATDNLLQTSTLPCEPVEYTIPGANTYPLFINEFMASNSSTVTDDQGEYEDWIELYNAGTEGLWLGDKYLTDNLSNPDKWKLPDFTLPPGSFLLIWADDQPEQGDFHTNFKLDKDQEEIGLFDNQASGFALIDSITYQSQTTDISLGRITDAAAEWKLFDIPTPGITNGPAAIEEQPLTNLHIYPNPANHGIIYLSEGTDFSIYDLTGRRIISILNSNQADISSLKPGLYLIITKNGESTRLIVN